MAHLLTLVFVALVIVYGGLLAVLHMTQSKSEPVLLPIKIPFLDPAIGIARHKVKYLVNLKKQFRLPIHTLRMPFQRMYVINAPHLIQAVQTKANLKVFVPNLLDFGMMFSGLSNEGRKVMAEAVSCSGNNFTRAVHKYLLSGQSLRAATRTAIDCLAMSVPNSLARRRQISMLEYIRHEMMLAMTSAIYGPENPYEDPAIEASWLEFVPGISHLLYSPFPRITARKALQARDRITTAFQKYYATGGHLQAFAMIDDMYRKNLESGLSKVDSARMEMATSLAMLSSGAITQFWLLFHIVSDAEILAAVRKELLLLVVKETKTATGYAKVVDASKIKTECHTFIAVFNEMLRYHSTLINVKKVAHDTTLDSKYYLKQNGTIMIPGTAVHHDTDIWGATAESFDHTRFFDPKGLKNLTNSTAFRPFGAGSTMCPGRNFSINLIHTMAVMLLLQYDFVPVGGVWNMPSKHNADLWNAMPKPDEDVRVEVTPRKDAWGVEWKFIWGDDGGLGEQ
ncbi:cytochrome P450 [Massarina eburnea CBS 473.64]|uniref:Cytochrome P450 n=1 Tax=Massarina eburnea CBS 473.64 TaxID=1395130 RepID=A0A6A6RJS8_9PLEO|nr:cytochrome P450 [Massarina eburnea CBS 473.64]